MDGELLEIYKRSAEDVSSMIKYAKLDESKLTDITQALYYPTEDNNGDDIRLLELNPHILSQIREGQVLSFKGGLNEKLVMCTDSKTYDVKEAEISNSLLLVPDLKHSQATSKSPLKSPRGNVNNRSLEKSFENEEDDVQMGTPSNRKLESRHVIKICHEYFECREINPRFRKLSELLLLTRYSGPENEYCIDRNLLFRFAQLLDTIQCSRLEFIDGLKKYRAIEIDGRIRVLEYEYEYRTISHMLGLINENSWKLDEIDRIETINALEGIVPLAVVEGLFDLYTEKSTIDGKFKYREDMVCRIIAENILQQGLKFHINDFITTWQDALPEGMKIDEKYLKGIGLIDRESSIPCVRSLIETNLSTNLNDRLKALFATKEKWTLEQIEPYILYFATPQLSISSILAKYSRSMTVSGQRVYVAKHGH